MIIVSGSLRRGPRPQFFSEIIHLRDQGVKTLINLQSGFYEQFNDDEYEVSTPQELGLRCIDIPCSDFGPPKPWQVDKFITAIQNFAPVYVHCLHGKDRTGFMVAAYRMRVQRWTFRQAVTEMFDHGFHKIPYIWWLWELKKYAK